MGFGGHHHYDGVDAKEKVNDDLVLNCNKLEFSNVEDSFQEMSVFGHHDGDGTLEKMEHGGEILNGDDDQFQNMKDVYVRMGCGHHHDGDYESLNGNGGDGEPPNVGHDDVFFGEGGVNDGDEIPTGTYAFHYAKNDDLGFGESCDGGDAMENEGVRMNYDDHLRGSDHDCDGDEGLVRQSGFSGYSLLYPWHLLNDHRTELVASCVPYGHVLTLSYDFWMIQFYC